VEGSSKGFPGGGQQRAGCPTSQAYAEKTTACASKAYPWMHKDEGRESCLPDAFEGRPSSSWC